MFWANLKCARRYMPDLKDAFWCKFEVCASLFVKLETYILALTSSVRVDICQT